MNIDLIIKILFENIFIYFIFFKICNIKTRKIDKVIIIIGSIVATAVYSLFNNNINHIFNIIFMYFVQIFFLKIILRYNTEQSLLVENLIANAICMISFYISILIEYPFKAIFNIENSTVNFLLIILIEFIVLRLLSKIRRIQKGLTFLFDKTRNEYSDIIMINISLLIIFVYGLFGMKNLEVIDFWMAPFVVLSVLLLILIKKTLDLYYKQKQLMKNLEEDEKNLQEKDKQIEKLASEKYEISKLNHQFYNRQKALELKVENLIANNNFNIEAANELTVMKQIKDLSSEYSEKLEDIKENDDIPKTKIEEIDDMFKYMKEECKNNNIEFNVKINSDIYHLVNKLIPVSDLVTLIGDHLRDAIIAVNSSNNKNRSILAILGIHDKCYEFCVYDSGVEFEINTLLKLGLEPITTHKNSGGSGIGFMTTFETLSKTKASLIIEEKHGEDEHDYTKAVKVRFDEKNEYKIYSYRAEEISKQCKDKRIIIEKLK